MEDQDKQHDGDGEHGGGDGKAEREPTPGDRLVKEIADRRTQRPRQDEGRPEQDHTRNPCPEMERGDHGERSAEHQRRAGIAEAAVRDPIAERGAEGLRQGDGDPVEGFRAWSDDGIDRNAAQRPIPSEERGKDAAQQQQRAARIADAERPGGEVGERRAGRRRGDDRGPIELGTEPSRPDLQPHQPDEQQPEDRRADEIAVEARLAGIRGRFAEPAHRHGIAARFAERGRQDLDDPEAERHRGNLGHCVGQVFTRHRGLSRS